MLIQIIVSAEVESKGKAVFNNLLFSYFFFNHLYDLLLSLVGCLKLLLKFLLFLCFLSRILYCFLLFYIRHLFFDFLLFNCFCFFWFLVYIDAYISFQTLSLQEVLAKFSFVFVVFLHKIDISMILSTSSSQMTLSHLILFTYCFSFHEWLAELLLCMSISTCQSFATVSAIRAHFCLVMSSFIILCDPFSFDVSVFCKQVIINKSAFKVMLILCVWISSWQGGFRDQRHWIDLFVSSYLLLVFWLSCLKIKATHLFL